METIGTSSNGQVEALVGGDFTVKRIVIRETCLRDAPDPDVVGELVREAINNAIVEVRRNAQEKMSEATGGLKLPGMG
jgi:DNA-binding protein YbaB